MALLAPNQDQELRSALPARTRYSEARVDRPHAHESYADLEQELGGDKVAFELVLGLKRKSIEHHNDMVHEGGDVAQVYEQLELPFEEDFYRVAYHYCWAWESEKRGSTMCYKDAVYEVFTDTDGWIPVCPGHALPHPPDRRRINTKSIPKDRC